MNTNHSIIINKLDMQADITHIYLFYIQFIRNKQRFEHVTFSV